MNIIDESPKSSTLEFDLQRTMNDDGQLSAGQEAHPWWEICLSLDESDIEAAWQRLQSWQQVGIPLGCVDQILQLNADCGTSANRKINRIPESSSTIHLNLFGISVLDWQAHAWLQRCDLPRGFRLGAEPCAIKVGLNLDSIENWLNRPQMLLELTEYQSIWDPDPARVALFLALSIPAVLLHNEQPVNGWLDRQNDAHDAMILLGLPHPQSLSEPDSVLVLGSSEGGGIEGLHPPLYGWPGFDHIQISDADSARLLAFWLEHCSRLGIQIVRLQPTRTELESKGFESLTTGKSYLQLKTQYFYGKLHFSVLKEELDWRRKGRPSPSPIHTPQPKAIKVWESCLSAPSTASICISLYNYQDEVISALESAKAQSERLIELIIVDDNSLDDSLNSALSWLQNNYSRFTRTLLLQHVKNSGLAATRNTAFKVANSDWCFVLDADNRLHSQAIERCLHIAAHASEEVGIVHPLIQRSRDNGSNNDSNNLISGLSWQRSHFLHGNYIDAMALVRKKAWQAVNGYSHIEDGWEDYDFWCKLTDTGFQGILCPQILATYVCHEKSMIANRTDRNVRRISRTLQARHPWLELPMAKDEV